MHRPDHFTITLPIQICGRLYEMEFISAGDGLLNSVIRLRYGYLWGMYPFWAWIKLPTMPDPIHTRTVWWGLN